MTPERREMIRSHLRGLTCVQELDGFARQLAHQGELADDVVTLELVTALKRFGLRTAEAQAKWWRGLRE